MSQFIKILILIVLLAALGIAVTYNIYRDDIIRGVHGRLSGELSKVLKYPVRIDRIEYILPQTFSLSGISILDTEAPVKEVASIKNIRITPEFFSAVKDRKLLTTIEMEGVNIGDLSLDADLKTESSAAGSYDKLFDPALLETVYILSGRANFEEHEFGDMNGVLDIEELKIRQGKLSFGYKDLEPICSFTALPSPGSGYSISMRSGENDLSGTFYVKDNDLLADDLTGTVYGTDIDMKAEAVNFALAEREIKLEGSIKTDLERLDSLPDKTGSLIEKYGLSGMIKSDIFLSFKGGSLKDCELNSEFLSDRISIKNVTLNGISGKLLLSRGSLNISPLDATFYNGKASLFFSVDLLEKDLPFTLNTEITDSEFGDILHDISGKDTSAYGNLNLKLFLRGDMDQPSSIAGNADISIYEANLGPMPLLSPLLGNIYAVMQNFLPGLKRIDITAAGANFDIAGRKIATENLTLWGDEIFITADGYVDFSGNLDFAVSNHIREIEPSIEESWQTSLRNAVAGFGKLISKAYLRGTISKPEWEFEYLNPIMDMIKNNIRGFLGI